MALNHYFGHVDNIDEQNLIDSLQEESIQISGIQTIYCPRTDVVDDPILMETTVAKFEQSNSIEMSIENVEEFGSSTMFGAFGFTMEDQVDLSVSKKRFAEEFENRFNKIPIEGDMIYLPFIKQWLEITKVSSGFPGKKYQAGKDYIWYIKTKVFEFNHEDIDTGYSDVDELSDLSRELHDSVLDSFEDGYGYENQDEQNSIVSELIDFSDVGPKGGIRL